MLKKNGGHAFPMAAGDPVEGFYDEGISLRDYFAGQALTAIAAGDERDGWDFTNRVAQMNLATVAYEMADAMLAIRDKEGT